MKKMIRLFIISGLVIGSFWAVGFAQENGDVRELFPADGTFEGWNLEDSISEFTGETLQNRLGEMAGLYQEYGVDRLLVAVYTNVQATKIMLELHRLPDPASAWGLFTMNSSGKGRPDTIGDVSMLYDQFVHLVKGPYYIKCTTSRKTEGSIQTIRAMGSYLAAGIDQHAKKPPLLLALETENDPVLYSKFFKGQRGLMEIIDFGHGSVAAFDEGAVVRKETLYHFIFRYNDERVRREWFASAKGKMKMNQRFSDYKPEGEGFTVLDRNGNTFTFMPYRNYILVVKDNDPVETAQTMERLKANLNRFIR